MLKKLKIILIILIFGLLSNTTTAVTFNSIQDGDWNNDNTWDGTGVPSSNGDGVILP